ncbi:hypothetical protein PCG10_000244 [Penicillium crustosum]|uniref:Rhodopsin domain-containing protein n=1 Tax=Penicillium crustosum TaxID=36656 RepID=A0A9P5L8Z5_PENCR|nr:hypothetical protein PCG10_000244 [Penicillium crustosum]
MSPELKNTWTPAINVLTWFMLVTAILSVLTRLGTKYFIFRKWTFDDGLVTTSLVLCIAQSIAISIATANGLGQHLGMLSDHKIETVMKDAWWKWLGITNILSECGIIGQALLVIVRIQTDFSRKAGLSSVFLIRVIVIIAIIFQLVYAKQTARGDFTYDAWSVAIATQVAQTVSIVTACSPQFKPFLDSLQSSGMGLGMTSSNNYGSKHKTYGTTTFKTFRRTADTRSETHELVSVPHEGTNHAMVTSGPDEDAESQSSQSNMIMETRTWTVTEGLPN